MSPDQIALVQKSFRKVLPMRAAAARMFSYFACSSASLSKSASGSA